MRCSHRRVVAGRKSRRALTRLRSTLGTRVTPILDAHHTDEDTNTHPPAFYVVPTNNAHDDADTRNDISEPVKMRVVRYMRPQRRPLDIDIRGRAGSTDAGLPRRREVVDAGRRGEDALQSENVRGRYCYRCDDGRLLLWRPL